MRLRALALITVLALSGCQQTMTSSTVRIGKEDLSAAERSDIVTRVYALVAEMNGGCEVRHPGREYHSCSLAGDQRYRLGVGYGPAGDYVISLHSTVVHFLPQSRKTVLSDKFLTGEQRKLEAWLLSLPPAGTHYTAKRIYIGYYTPDGSEAFSKDF